MADDLGVMDLRCYGRNDHSTPNLDNLAREGMRFASAYCALPICSPSRAALMTGKNPARLHLTTFLPGRKDAPSQKLLHPQIRQELPREELTIAELLKPAGYRSAWIGKWHLGGQGFLPPDQGFDFYHPGKANTQPSDTEGGKGEYDLTSQAEKWLEQNHRSPFLLFVSHNSPHINYSAKPQLIEKNRSAFDPTYAALIETLDDAVGRLLRKLDTLGIRDNTVVIFTSDNGGLHVPEGAHKKITYNHPFRAGKGFLYEGGLRIPLIVRWPGKISAGRVIDAPVINTDWVPTLLDLTGTKGAVRNLDGTSLARVLLGQGRAAKRSFFWHFPHYTNQGGVPSGAVREEQWKYIEYYEDDRAELYDLEKDPHEQQNLARERPRLVQKYRKKLAEWREEVGAQSNTPNPEFNPDLHRPIYVDVDVSLYNPLQASEEQFGEILHWRRAMIEAIR